jgi:hypothetical protein
MQPHSSMLSRQFPCRWLTLLGLFLACAGTAGAQVLVPVPGSPFKFPQATENTQVSLPNPQGTLLYVLDYTSNMAPSDITVLAIGKDGALTFSGKYSSPFVKEPTETSQPQAGGLAFNPAGTRLYVMSRGRSLAVKVNVHAVNPDGSLALLQTVQTGGNGGGGNGIRYLSAPGGDTICVNNNGGPQTLSTLRVLADGTLDTAPIVLAMPTYGWGGNDGIYSPILAAGRKRVYGINVGTSVLSVFNILQDGSVAVAPNPNNPVFRYYYIPYPYGVDMVAVDRAESHIFLGCNNYFTDEAALITYDISPEGVLSPATVIPLHAWRLTGLDVSPDGKTVAASSEGYSFADFGRIDLVDIPTGVVRNGWTSNQFGGLFGLQFSPDGSLLFVATPVQGATSVGVFRLAVPDTDPPVVTIPSDITVEATSAAGAVVTFTVSAIDAVDGAVAATATPASGSTFPLGATSVSVTAADKAGNMAAATFTVTVRDTTPPTTTNTLSGLAGSNGWYRGPVTVSLTAVDPHDVSGVAATYYTVDGIGKQLYTVPFQVSDDGMHTVTLWSVDRAGNEEIPHPSVTFKIDSTPPVITCPKDIIAATDTGKNSTTVDPSLATATDSNPGAAVTGIRSDNKGLTEPYPLGTTTIAWSAADAAGNVGTGAQTITVKDTEPPKVTCSLVLVKNGHEEDENSALFQVVFSATDNCGIKSVTACIEGSDKKTGALHRITVTNGQTIHLQKSTKWATRTKNGTLRIRGYNLKLIVTAVDTSGNIAQSTVVPILRGNEDSGDDDGPEGDHGGG